MFSPIEDSIAQLVLFQKDIMGFEQPNFEELVKMSESYNFITSKPKMINFFQTLTAAMKARPANASCYLNVIQHFKDPINLLLFSNHNFFHMPQNRFFQNILVKAGIGADTFQLIYQDGNKNDLTEKDESIDNELFDIILKDDIEKFQIIVSQNNMELNRKINYCESNARKPSGAIVSAAWELPYIVELVAYFGSAKIFKYLWVNNINDTLHLLEYAYSGGNYEIIHLVENVSNERFVPNPVECVKKAICHYHNELITYAIEKYNLSVSNYSFDLDAIDCYNAEAFLMLFKDSNPKKSNHYVDRKKYIFAQYYLDSIEEKNHIKGDEGNYLLYSALQMGDIDFVRLLFDDLENVNFLFLVFFFVYFFNNGELFFSIYSKNNLYRLFI